MNKVEVEVEVIAPPTRLHVLLKVCKLLDVFLTCFEFQHQGRLLLLPP